MRHLLSIGSDYILGVEMHNLSDRRGRHTLSVTEAEAEAKREVGANYEEVK